jgi:uncharacterized protein (DUF2267 family)
MPSDPEPDTLPVQLTEQEMLARIQRRAPIDQDLSRRVLLSTLRALLGSLPLALSAQVRIELPRELGADLLPDRDVGDVPTLKADPRRAAPTREALVEEVSRATGLDVVRALELAEVCFVVLAEGLSGETRLRLTRELPAALATWLRPPEHGAAPVHVGHGHTLADGGGD